MSGFFGSLGAFSGVPLPNTDKDVLAGNYAASLGLDEAIRHNEVKVIALESPATLARNLQLELAKLKAAVLAKFTAAFDEAVTTGVQTKKADGTTNGPKLVMSVNEAYEYAIECANDLKNEKLKLLERMFGSDNFALADRLSANKGNQSGLPR